MRNLIAVGVGLGWGSATTAAQAGVPADAPDPAHCSVTPCDQLGGVVLVPDLPTISPASDILVSVRNASNAPIRGWNAFCEFEAGALCTSAVLTGVTNSAGEVRFRFTGGGCATQTGAVRIVVTDGVDEWTIRSYDLVKSPDFDGAGGSGDVDIADLLAFSSEFLNTTSAACHDYDSSGVTDLADLVILSPAFVVPASCP